MDKIEYDLACSVSTMLGKAIVDLRVATCCPNTTAAIVVSTNDTRLNMTA